MTEKEGSKMSEHTENKDQVLIDKEDLLELIHWARRYCDGRSSYAPHRFNELYRRIRSMHSDFIRNKDTFDQTLKDGGTFWPYAQDGMYDENINSFNAVK